MQVASRYRNERAIEPLIVGRTRDQESDRIAIADDAEAAVIVRDVGVQRRIGLEPRIAAALDGGRVGPVAANFQNAVDVRLGQVGDRAFESGVCSTRTLPEDVAYVRTLQRIPRSNRSGGR